MSNNKIDVSKCKDFEKATCFDNDFDEIEFDYCKLFDEPCEDVRNNNRCTYKLKQQIQQLKAENKELKSYLNKIREEELKSLDIEWDEYETECRTTDYSNIVTLVEEALGENNE